jgi:hypothetical protein
VATAAVRTPSSPALRARETSAPPHRTAWLTYSLPALVLAVALATAAGLFSHFQTVHRHLWDNSTHDRNAHYLFALRLATDVRQGHVLALLEHLSQASVWPPLHGVLAAGVLLVGGLDYRWAVLPSLAAYALTALLAFLVARRSAPRGGNYAGLVAALLVLASPAHRAYATDMMLESLGACLSLLVVYCYLLAVQGRPTSLWSGRWLGLALTALFLEKYNYWLLVVLALFGAELTARPRALWDALGAPLVRLSWRAWLRAQLRHPLTYVLAATLLVAAGVALHGDRPVVLAGREISLYPPHNVLQAAYVVLFLRLVAWWRGAGRAWAAGLDGRARQVVLWHVGPMAWWFLLPRHPSNFIWYLSLANGGDGQKVDLAEGARCYGAWAVQDYHATFWVAVAAGALALLAVCRWRRVRPGGQAVLWLLLVGAALTLTHPNRKARGLHSWLPAGWVAAGLGLAALTHGRLTRRRPRLRPWLAGAAVAGLGWAAWPALAGPGHALEGGPHPERPCLLDLVDCYLPDLDGSRHATILSARALKPLAQWAYLERHGRLDGLEENWYGFGAASEANRLGFLHWLRTTNCDTLVYVEALPGLALWEDVPEARLHAELSDLVRSQQVFALAKEQGLPHLACRVQVWKRKAP